MARVSVWGWPPVAASTSAVGASCSIRRCRSATSAFSSLATCISTGMGTSCTWDGSGSSSLGNVYYEWKLLPRSLRMQKPCDHAQRVYSRNLAFSRCRQSERVLQEQDMVVCRSIHDLDAVDGLNILFDVYFLRMRDIMLNS